MRKICFFLSFNGATHQSHNRLTNESITLRYRIGLDGRATGTPGTVGAVSNVYFDNGGEEMSIRDLILTIIPISPLEMNRR